jgi:hypothetical protein
MDGKPSVNTMKQRDGRLQIVLIFFRYKDRWNNAKSWLMNQLSLNVSVLCTPFVSMVQHCVVCGVKYPFVFLVFFGN